MQNSRSLDSKFRDKVLGYSWDVPVKTFDDLDAASAPVGADGGTSTHATLTRTDTQDDTPHAQRIAERARGLDARVGAVLEGFATLRRRPDRGDSLIALRRISGAFGTVCDALYDIVDHATASPLRASVAAYVECVLWWMTELLSGVETALRCQSEAERCEEVSRAAEFASLYASGRLDSLKDRTAIEHGGDGLVGALHQEVLCLASSLRLTRDAD